MLSFYKLVIVELVPLVMRALLVSTFISFSVFLTKVNVSLVYIREIARVGVGWVCGGHS